MYSFLKKRRHRPSSEMELNITSMADIFTILLVFLLKSYASSAIQITPTAGLKLPATTSVDSGHIEALKVELSSTHVTLEDQEPLPTNLKYDVLVKKLNSMMSAARKQQMAHAKADPKDVKADSRIILVSDQSVPYKMVRTVLNSAATQGFTDFKLAVVEKN